MGEAAVAEFVEKKALNSPSKFPSTTTPTTTTSTHSTVRSAAEAEISAWGAPSLPKPSLPPSPPSIAAPSMSRKEASVEARKTWNTRNLGMRLGADLLAAGSAAVLVAPIITMIDKGIMENASGRNTLGESLKSSARELLARPQRFITGKPFLLVFSLYCSTYFTANAIDTTASTVHNTPIASTTAGTSKFLATSTTNLAICLYKDNQFTQMFGSTGGPKRAVPLPTFSLFTVRDCLTIFASFNLPTLIAPKLQQHMGTEIQKYMSAASAAQFMTPAAVQLISTPLHLLGLDLYNRQGVKFLGQDGRAARVVRDWAKSAFARMGRIIPAFGVGGVVNTKVRRNFMDRLS